MDEKILALYCLCADVLNVIGHTEDPQQQMSDAEVITTGLVALCCSFAATLKPHVPC